MATTALLQKQHTLFGGDRKWKASDWTSSDDRVRGGKSESFLDCTNEIARFNGTLDIKTLGGAGFASQRTVADLDLDLSEYAGVQICVAKSDKKRYTINFKDTLLPPDPETGRAQSTISYEADFELPPQSQPGETDDRTVFIPFDALNASYRGKLKKDAKPIDLKHVKRMSIMMRSFFGAQEGDFSLSMRSIVALSEIPKAESNPTAGEDDLEKGLVHTPHSSSNVYYVVPAGGLFEVRVDKRVAQLILGGLSLVAVYFFVGNVLRT